MNRLTASIRVLVLVGVVTALVAMTAVPSSACECLDRLMPWNWCKSSAAPSATTYAPPYTPAVACAPQSQQVCAYVPQTCYKTVYGVTPVTTCMPVVGYDGCGCPVTCYQPMTSYVRCSQLVPYTTYRRVWTTVGSPCGVSSCSPCGVGGCSPCGTTGSSSSGCSSCTPSAPSTGTPTPIPSLPSQPSMPSQSNTPSQSSLPPLPSYPSGVQGGQSNPPGGFQGSGGSSSTRETRKEGIEEAPLAPIPVDSTKTPVPAAPKINAPDRTTARPVEQIAYHSSVAPSPTPVRHVDNSGWVADRD